jgi:hypothetical protein
MYWRGTIYIGIMNIMYWSKCHEVIFLGAKLKMGILTLGRRLVILDWDLIPLGHHRICFQDTTYIAYIHVLMYWFRICYQDTTYIAYIYVLMYWFRICYQDTTYTTYIHFLMYWYRICYQDTTYIAYIHVLMYWFRICYQDTTCRLQLPKSLFVFFLVIS